MTVCKVFDVTIMIGVVVKGRDLQLAFLYLGPLKGYDDWDHVI